MSRFKGVSFRVNTPGGLLFESEKPDGELKYGKLENQDVIYNGGY